MPRISIGEADPNANILALQFSNFGFTLSLLKFAIESRLTEAPESANALTCKSLIMIGKWGNLQLILALLAKKQNHYQKFVHY